MTSTALTGGNAPSSGLRVRPEIEPVLELLSSHMHLDRTQVVEQAVLRLGRQLGVITAPLPVAFSPENALPGTDADQFAAVGNEAFTRIWDTPEEDAAWAHLQEAM